MQSNPSRAFDYALVDVFAERALEGNMLAIFTDARGLSTLEMQALARETNLAETTFILPADDPAQEREHGVEVRIFTTQEELPFAGHPTLGTASWLFWNHPTLRGAASLTLRLPSGPITVRFEPPAAAEQGVFGTMRQRDPVFGRVYDRAQIAAVLDLDEHDLDPVHPVQTVSTGMPFCIVPLRSAEALSRLVIPQVAAQRWLDASDAKFFYVVAPCAAGERSDFRCRMQFYNGEDPATGSASGCAIAYLVEHGLAASNDPVVFEQGIAIARPSRIHVRASRVDGRITDVFVGGRTIAVASGRFLLP
jgi:trans-2,3-dihydro-3-hydroxyanthranilate isomerase